MADTGVFPNEIAGGLPIRDQDGAPTNPVAVENAYVPAPEYVSTCDLTALPSDCTARIEPRQINAIVSELLSFAECLDADGPWDCASPTNLCAAFLDWVSKFHPSVFVTPPELTGNGLEATPITFTGITTGPATGEAAQPSGFRGVGLSTDPLILEVIDGGTH